MTKPHTTKIIASWLTLMSLLSLPLFVFAQADTSFGEGFRALYGEATAGSHLQDDSNLAGIIQRAINWFLALVGVIAVGVIIYAGLLLIVGRGEEAQMEKAKKAIFWAILGLILTILAWAIINIVTNQILAP